MTNQLDDALPPFDCTVPVNGYRWWYVDGLSDCGSYGIVIIAFVGSVFSPYYYFARQRCPADPENHCAINVALYSPSGKDWAMTERGRGAVTRSPRRLDVALSSLRICRDGQLAIDIDERSVPWGRTMRGTVRVTTETANRESWQLDHHGRHTWQPVAPGARITVDFERPAVNWTGEAYVDSNSGAAPLEDGFSSWDWSRCRTASATHIRYRAIERGGRIRTVALRHSPGKELVEEEDEPVVSLPATGWRIQRQTQARGPVRVARTLEDTPFYARSVLEMAVGTETFSAVHESLSLERFSKTWVRSLLPFRMPRRR